MQFEAVGALPPRRQERPQSTADAADRRSSVKPQEAAELATEAVRTLARATLPGGYQWPSDLYAVIAQLTVLIRALPTILGQAATWLEAEHDVGRIHCDDGHNLTLTIHGTLLGLHDAARHTEPLLRALNTATQHAGRLTSSTP
jgi:hypothetical protein